MKTATERKTDQRQRDAAALDAFAQALSMCNINLRRYDADGEHVSKLPAFANWREMMVWIRETFGKETK